MVRPSLLLPLASTTAWIRSPSARASASRLSTTTPPPSARTNPSASAENAEHRPFFDSIDACEKPT